MRARSPTYPVFLLAGSPAERQFSARQNGAVTAKESESWTIRHFSQANPRGKGQADVAALLRRVADSSEARGHIEVQDITFGTEITDDGPWPSLTVYLHEHE